MHTVITSEGDEVELYAWAEITNWSNYDAYYFRSDLDDITVPVGGYPVELCFGTKQALEEFLADPYLQMWSTGAQASLSYEIRYPSEGIAVLPSDDEVYRLLHDARENEDAREALRRLLERRGDHNALLWLTKLTGG